MLEPKATRTLGLRKRATYTFSEMRAARKRSVLDTAADSKFAVIVLRAERKHKKATYRWRSEKERRARTILAWAVVIAISRQ